jgi:hypothetical protein
MHSEIIRMDHGHRVGGGVLGDAASYPTQLKIYRCLSRRLSCLICKLSYFIKKININVGPWLIRYADLSYVLIYVFSYEIWYLVS